MIKHQKILIKNGTLVSHLEVTKADILIENGKISQTGDLLNTQFDLVIDAEGLLILPGLIDSHVHFNDKFMNTISVHDFYTGTRAAAFGGVTSVIDFSNQEIGEPLTNTVFRKQKEAEGKALVDWGVHPVITSPDRKTINDIKKVISLGAPTIKCYMTYQNEGLLIKDNDLQIISEKLQSLGGMLMIHAEDDDTLQKMIRKMITSENTKPIYHARSRPREVEDKAIIRLIRIAKRSKGKIFIVHMASSKGIELIKSAQKKDINIFCETCTHYLIFTDSMLKKPEGIKWICSPPLRDFLNQQSLWEGINSRIISLVTSDDAAYSWEAKLLGKDRFDLCPNGIPGVEPRLNLLYSYGVAENKISLPKLVEITSTNPAKFFGLFPEKGNLNPGADADLVLFNPNEEWIMNQDSLHMNTDWSAYDNLKIKGKIKKVLLRGQLIIDGERCLAQKGYGKYLFRKLDKELYQ